MYFHSTNKMDGWIAAHQLMQHFIPTNSGLNLMAITTEMSMYW